MTIYDPASTYKYIAQFNDYIAFIIMYNFMNSCFPCIACISNNNIMIHILSHHFQEEMLLC